jgi:hypothetical protein
MSLEAGTDRVNATIDPVAYVDRLLELISITGVSITVPMA